MKDWPLKSDVVFHRGVVNFVPDGLHCIPEFASLNSPWVDTTSADQPSPGQLWPGLASNPIPPGTPNKVHSWLALSISAPC